MNQDGELRGSKAAWQTQSKVRKVCRPFCAWAVLMVMLVVSAGQAGAATMGDALLQAVADNEILATRDVVEQLRATEDPAQIWGAADQLVGLLDDPTFGGRSGMIDAWLAAMRELDPAQGASALARWLVQDDAELRLVATVALGRLRHESAVTPLEAELTWAANQADIRQASASSLALIGGAQAGQALLEAYATGDAELRQTIAKAIVSYGDAGLQAKLATLT